jgi:hypothetical protein
MVTDFEYTARTKWGQIEKWARDTKRQVVLAVHTPWWSLWEDEWLPYTIPGSGGIPCDPRGSVLIQTNMAKAVQQARDNPGHYGWHGLLAFAAAFHGNVVVKRTGKPTSLKNWNEYNELLDLAGVVS